MLANWTSRCAVYELDWSLVMGVQEWPQVASEVIEDKIDSILSILPTPHPFSPQAPEDYHQLFGQFLSFPFLADTLNWIVRRHWTGDGRSGNVSREKS